MANFVEIVAETRARSGKGGARATRRAGLVPGVIYGGHKAPSLIALEPRAVLRELHTPGWQSRVYDIKADGASTRALIRDVQYHPVTDQPEHIDFQRLAPGERIRVSVPVHFENEGLSSGIKRGAVLNVVRHAVEVLADPDNIPQRFIADLTGLDFNDTIRWHDLQGAEGVRSVIGDRDFVIATVAPPVKAAEVAAEPGAAPAPGAPTPVAVAKPATGAAKAPAGAKAPAAPKKDGKKK